MTVTPLCHPMPAAQRRAAAAVTQLCHPEIAAAVSPPCHPGSAAAVSALCHPGIVAALSRWPRPGPAPRPSRLPSGRGHGGAGRGPPRHRQRCPAAGAAQGRGRGADQGVLRAAGGGRCPGRAGPGRGAPCGPAGPAPSQPPPLPSQQKGVGMHEPLVDAEGFPRSDIDLYQVRTARHNIICERGTGTGRGGSSRGRARIPRDEPGNRDVRDKGSARGPAPRNSLKPPPCSFLGTGAQRCAEPVPQRFCSVLGAAAWAESVKCFFPRVAEILPLLRSHLGSQKHHKVFLCVCRIKFG